MNPNTVEKFSQADGLTKLPEALDALLVGFGLFDSVEPAAVLRIYAAALADFEAESRDSAQDADADDANLVRDLCVTANMTADRRSLLERELGPVVTTGTYHAEKTTHLGSLNLRRGECCSVVKSAGGEHVWVSTPRYASLCRVDADKISAALVSGDLVKRSEGSKS